MTEFRPRPGLDALVAAMVAPTIQETTERIAVTARRLAPPTKRWASRGDPIVRREHRAADGQEVPDNLRFVLDSPAYDRQHYGAGARQLLRQPRDPDATPGLTVNCRCTVVRDPLGIARHIRAHPVRLAGPVTIGRITCAGDRVVEAEFGNGDDLGARFMGLAVAEVARRLRLA